MKKVNKLWVLLGGILAVLLVGGVITVLANSGEGKCTLPEGSVFVNVSGYFTIDGMGKRIYILRGIAMGQPSSSYTDAPDTVPACFTREEGLITYENMFLLDSSGNRIALLKGVGGINTEVVQNPLP